MRRVRKPRGTKEDLFIYFPVDLREENCFLSCVGDLKTDGRKMFFYVRNWMKTNKQTKNLRQFSEKNIRQKNIQKLF